MLRPESVQGGVDRAAERAGDSSTCGGAAFSSSSSSTTTTTTTGNTVGTALLIPGGGGGGSGVGGGDAGGGGLEGEAAVERARVRVLEGYLVLVSGVGLQCRALVLNHTPSLSCLRLLLLAPVHEAPRGAVVGVGQGGGQREGQGGGDGEVSRRERGLVLDILAALQTGDNSREEVLVMQGFPLVLVSLVAYKLLSCRASQRAGEGGGGGGGGGGEGKARQEVEEGRQEEGEVERCEGEDGEEQEASEDEVSDGEEEDAQRPRYTLAPKLTARESTATILKSP
jgi:hypothetical protein